MPLNRSSVLTTTVALLAAAGSTAGASSAQTPIRDFTEIVSSLKSSGSSLAYNDYNLDGVVTDLDILATALDAIRSWTPNDIDGDGAVTAADTTKFLSLYIGTTHGDADGDDRIGNGDFIAVVPEVFSNTPHISRGDVNGDLRVDGRDLYAIAHIVVTESDENWNNHTPFTNQAHRIVDEIERVGIEEIEKFIRGEYAVLLDGHLESISKDYPPHGSSTSAGHHRTSSSLWPPNHTWNVSRHWSLPATNPGSLGPPNSLHFLHGSASWPPNHSRTSSDTWYYYPARHDSLNSDSYVPEHRPQNHHHYISKTEAYHNNVFSAQWKEHPGHRSTISVSWPGNHTPGIDRHELRVSRSWPSNHWIHNSEQRKLEHLYDISLQIGPMDDGGTPPKPILPDSHETGLSKVYIPNHESSISRDRLMGHSQWNSAFYPPNHVSVISSTWPAGSPVQWPANHFNRTSVTWSEPPNPVLPTRVFPPDHSWWTTVKEAKDMVPIPGIKINGGD